MNEQEQLVERLSRFYHEAKLEVSATPPVWTPPGQRAGRWVQPVLASVALAVVVLSAGFAIKVARDRAAQVRVAATPTVSAAPSPTMTPTATPSATPAPSPDANWVTQRFPIGSVGAMLLDPSAVFSLAQTKVVRIDRSTGAVTTGEALPDASGLARTTAGVWIAAGPGIAPAATNTQLLTLVDPATLKVQRQIHLPGQPGSDMNAGPQLVGGSQLWLGYGTGLYRLNPDTGDTLSSQSLAGTATSLSIDPSGQRLYVGIGPSQTQPATVMELDATTGSRLASANTGGAGLGGPHVIAAADGVWVSYATGTMGLVEHRSAANLSILGSAIRTSNTIHAVVSMGALWIVDGMAQQLTCADPASGATRASTKTQNQPWAFAADASGGYLGDNTGVAALQPPATCRG